MFMVRGIDGGTTQTGILPTVRPAGVLRPSPPVLFQRINEGMTFLKKVFGCAETTFFRRPVFYLYYAEPKVGCVAPRRRTRSVCRTANPSVSRKPQTACVAAPHTLPWQQRPSEKCFSETSSPHRRGRPESVVARCGLVALCNTRYAAFGGGCFLFRGRLKTGSAAVLVVAQDFFVHGFGQVAAHGVAPAFGADQPFDEGGGDFGVFARGDEQHSGDFGLQVGIDVADGAFVFVVGRAADAAYDVAGADAVGVVDEVAVSNERMTRGEGGGDLFEHPPPLGRGW